MLIQNWRALLIGGPIVLMAAGAQAQQASAPTPLAALMPVTEDLLRNPPDGDWLTWR